MMEGEGDCYPVAWKMVTGNPLDHDSEGELTLCHGMVVGQGPIEGMAHSHAWVERTDMVAFPGHAEYPAVTCIDHANGNDIELPQQLYYKVGQVTDVHRYDRLEAMTNAARTRHYGPWHD